MNIPDKPQFNGIIFDLDGTLANTHLDFQQICIDAELPIGTKLLEHCLALKDKKRANEILSIVEQHELDGASRAEWILDAQQLLESLYNANVPMAIVTRNMKVAAQLTIKKLNIPIELVITRDDCLPKPDPDGLLMVAQQWNFSPKDLIYVGDYKFDIMAAQSANMFSCLLLNDRNKEFCVTADKVIEKFEQLKPHFRLI